MQLVSIFSGEADDGKSWFHLIFQGVHVVIQNIVAKQYIVDVADRFCAEAAAAVAVAVRHTRLHIAFVC